MGLFSKKPKIVVCDMCGKTDAEGCGSAMKHVEEIRGDQPSWLPAHLRSQAPGQHTWLCMRCNSFPAMKWPNEGGAWAGMVMHLGSAHHVGDMQSMGRPPFEMMQRNQ